MEEDPYSHNTPNDKEEFDSKKTRFGNNSEYEDPELRLRNQLLSELNLDNVQGVNNQYLKSLYPNAQKPKKKDHYDEKECTFKPKINQISRSMAGYVRPLSLEDSLAYYQEKKKKTMDNLKKKYKKDVIKWTFQPEISKKSR